MTTRARIGVLVAVLALAAVGFVLARASGDDGSTTDTPAEATTETGAATTEAATTATEQATTPQPGPARPRVTRIVVAGGQLQGGLKRIRVNSGDGVRLLVTSDVADTVHVHGYDIQKDVGPGKNARFDFKATIEGSFEIELEERGLEIASLAVRP